MVAVAVEKAGADRRPGVAAADMWIRRHPWMTDSLLAVGLAALALPVSAAAVWNADWSLPGRVVGVVALATGHLSIVARRSAPTICFAVVSGMMLTLLLLPDAGGQTAQKYDGAIPPILLPSACLFAVATYTVAAWCTARLSWAALGVGVAGVAAAVPRLWASDYLTVTRPGQPDATPLGGWQLFLVVAAATVVIAPWSLGRFRAVRAQYVLALEERARREEIDRREEALRVVREERARIAREMHDVVAHSLSVIVSQAEGGRMMAQQKPGVTIPVLETVARTGQEAMKDMRRLLDTLHPDDVERDRSPQPVLADLPVLVEKIQDTGLAIELVEVGDPVALSKSAELTAYRTVQESLTNVIKHADPESPVDLTLHWQPQELTVSVRNDGGPPSSPRASDPGHGLVGMQERLALVGGTLEAGPASGGGFRVVARIPAGGDVRKGAT